MPRIAIDLMPLRPGGENGGAKVLVLELLKSFKAQAPQDNFLLLTAAWNHEELCGFNHSNMQCILIKNKLFNLNLFAKSDVPFDGRLAPAGNLLKEFNFSGVKPASS